MGEAEVHSVAAGIAFQANARLWFEFNSIYCTCFSSGVDKDKATHVSVIQARLDVRAPEMLSLVVRCGELWPQFGIRL